MSSARRAASRKESLQWVRVRIPVFVALIFIATTAAKCVTVADNASLSLNIENVSSTFLVSPGAAAFTNPNNCVTRNVADYLSNASGQISGGRLVDIQLQTFGAFSGSVVFGTLSVNGIQILSYNGPWSNFEVRRSLLSGVELQRHSAGVEELLDAVAAGEPILLCVGGSFSQPAAADLSVEVVVKAQVDVRVD